MSVVDRDATSTVASFYSALQYPGPEALITYIWANRFKRHLSGDPFLLLDAGCGAGRHTAGFLQLFPRSRAVCMDIAGDSLAAARALFEKIGVMQRAAFKEQSYLDPIVLDAPVDVVIAIGTIHHCPKPMAALANIAGALKPGGLLGLMVYSDRGSRRRYEIKEAIGLLGGAESLDRTAQMVRDHETMHGGVWNRSPRHTISLARNVFSHAVNRMVGRRRHGYLTDLDSRVMVADAYMSPIDRGFDARQLQQLVERASLEVVEMCSHGRPDESLLPESWTEAWRALPFWDRVRVSELIDPAPTSWSLICRKAG